MMQVRCQRCGWVFTLSRDAIGFAVAEAQASEAEYYQEPCPKCRNVIKIQVRELRKRLPADYTLPVLPPKPAPVHVSKDEEPKAAASPPAPTPALEPKPKKPPKPKAEPVTEPKAASRPKAAAKPKAAPRPSSKK
jgi:outer membrane biosynthesis protein TonB